jgi:steroid delta-isomerase-like uncharacterized protein
MSSEANKALARRWFLEAWPNPASPVLDEIVAESWQFHDPASPDVGAGVAGARNFMAPFQQAFPDLRFSIEEQLAEGNRVLTRWVVRGTHRDELMGIPPTGREVQLSGMTVQQIADGKIVEDWANWDLHGMLRQLGVLS